MRLSFLLFCGTCFGEFSEFFGEVSCLSWIDNDDGECGDKFSFEFSGGFENDLLGLDFLEAFDERLDSFGGIGYNELFVVGQDVQNELAMLNVTVATLMPTNVFLFFSLVVEWVIKFWDTINFLSCLCGLFALATVRTWNE